MLLLSTTSSSRSSRRNSHDGASSKSISCHSRSTQVPLGAASGKPGHSWKEACTSIPTSMAAHFNHARGGSHASEAEAGMYEPLSQSDHLWLTSPV